MYQGVDSIGGKPITFTYQAPQLPVSNELGSWAHARQLHQFVKSNAGKALLRIEDETLCSWLAAPSKGVSLSAAIEHWLQQQADESTKRFVMVIPLDQRIYYAEIDHGLVTKERLVSRAQFEQERDAWQQDQTELRLYKAGQLSHVITDNLTPQPLPLDPWAFEFTPTFKAFVQQKLIHPGAVNALGVFLVVGVLAQQGYQYLQREEAEVQALEAAAVAQALAPTAEFSASAQILDVAAYLTDDALVGLHRDNIERLSWRASDAKLEYIGRIERHYPENSAAFAEYINGEFVLTPNEWRIEKILKPVTDSRTVDEFVSSTLSSTIYQLGTLNQGEVRLSSTLDHGPVTESLFTLTLSTPNRFSLQRLSSYVDGLPISLLEAQCEYGEWRLTKCEFNLSSRGMNS